MKIFLTGSTGFLGRALALRLLRDGHQVTAWVRSARRARAVLGGEPTLLEADSPTDEVLSAMRAADAVVHLAGAGIFDRRWSRRRKKELVDSRVGLTRALVRGLALGPRRPQVWVSASAVGYYGVNPATDVDEDSAAGEDFLATLCKEWEREALAAERFGLRVALIRTGVVLGQEGGALAKMLPPLRTGLGGRLGSGQQPVPWIHLADAVEIFARAVTDEQMSGAYNAVAPHPVTNDSLTRAIGKRLHRPTLLPVPRAALRLALGQAASVVLGGQRAAPKRLLEAGFTFEFPRLGAALEDLLGAGTSTIQRLGPRSGIALPDCSYLAARGADYLLTQRTIIEAPLDEVFPFFAAAENLGAITPPQMTFRITDKPAAMHAGAEIAYALRLGPLPLTWRSRIEVWEPGSRFVDAQLKGPYRSWWHEHAFEADPINPARTIMTDRVYYRLPLGPIGRLAHPLVVAPQLRGIFRFRDGALRFRFPAVASQPTAGGPARAQNDGQETVRPDSTRVNFNSVLAGEGNHAQTTSPSV